MKIRNLIGSVLASLALMATAVGAGIDYTNLIALGSSLGSSIRSEPILRSNELFMTCYSGGDSLNGTVMKYTISSGTATLLHTFTPFQGTNGGNPFAPLTLLGNTFYGTTAFGGTNNSGIVFKMEPDGTFSKILDLDYTSNIGNGPEKQLTASGGLLYGSAMFGGPYNKGSLFCITTNGAIQWTKSMDGTNGRSPTEVFMIGDYLYGATFGGGAHGDGNTFKISKYGTNMTTLFSFSGNDGAYPTSLSLGPDGKMYGTTQGEYGESRSSIFVMDTNGIPSILAQIEDDKDYFLGVSFGPNGLMYAITKGSGISGNAGRIYQVGTNGSILRLVTFPYRSPSITNLYVSKLTFGPDNKGYFGFRYTNAFGSLSIPQWTYMKYAVTTCSNTTYGWSSVAGQKYDLQLKQTLNDQWTNHILVTATNGTAEYVGPAITGKPSEFARVMLYTTNTLTGFDVAMTNGAILNWKFNHTEQRDVSCMPQGNPCTNCPPSDPPSFP